MHPGALIDEKASLLTFRLPTFDFNATVWLVLVIAETELGAGEVDLVELGFFFVIDVSRVVFGWSFDADVRKRFFVPPYDGRRSGVAAGAAWSWFVRLACGVFRARSVSLLRCAETAATRWAAVCAGRAFARSSDLRLFMA